MNRQPDDRDDDTRPGLDRLNRRQLLRNMGIAGAAFGFAPLLSACGDDDDEASTEAGAGGDAGAATPGSEVAVSDDVGQRLREMLGVEDATAGGDITFEMGAVLAFSGPGAFYGETMSRGIDLAVSHVKAAGGPAINVTYKDHKSGDAQAGVDAMREIGLAGIPAKLASYVDDLGAMLPGTAQYKCFTLDGGGGTSLFGQGQDFFWGTRAITPNDAIPGLLKWTKEEYPDATTLGFIGWDLGEPINGQIRDDILAKFEAAGYEFNGLFELYPVGSSDFSTVIPRIRDNEPDILIAYGSGQDPGHFTAQYRTSGLEAPVMNFELTPDGVNASRGTYDDGFIFAADYFDDTVGVSPLAKLFVEEFAAAYDGAVPDFYAANFYENTLVMWEVIRRVLANGGDVNSGEALDLALRENLTVVSVYGGDESEIGSYTLDEETHSVVLRPMGVFEYSDGGTVTPKALFNIDGADFEIV